MNAGIRAWIDRHHLLSFVAIAYAFTWTIQGQSITSKAHNPFQ
jgi:hypothetical protein